MSSLCINIENLIAWALPSFRKDVFQAWVFLA